MHFHKAVSKSVCFMILIQGLFSVSTGAAFALLSFTEILSFLTSTVSFLMLYSATVGIYHGFAWLVAAAIVVIPFSLIM